MKCICGREFESKRSTAKYCSAKCRKLAFLSVPDNEVSVPFENGNSLSVPRVGNDADKCLSCVTHLENKKLLAKIALLELEISKRVHTAVVSDGDLNRSIGLPRLKPLGNNYKPNSLYGA